MIGSALYEALTERGDQVVRLVRNNAGKDDVLFDLRTFGIDRPAYEGFDAFIHLGGINIGEKRLTERRKQAIWDSRVVTTEFLTRIIGELRQPPTHFIVASAVGYYGSRGETPLTEASSKGTGFFAELCDYWESAAREAEAYGCRVVNTRSGVVLDKDGGTLQRQIPMFKLMLGGRLGSGHQLMSWISLKDEVRALMHVLDNDSLSGPVNLTSPNPVKNGEYTLRLAIQLNRLAFIPTPRPLLRLALGTTMTDELLLTSQAVFPQKLLNSGFEFQFPLLQDALADIFEPESEPETDDNNSKNESNKDENP